MTVLTQSQEASKKTSWRGVLLVATTCVGGGMLAMPIQTAEAGFALSSLVLFISWAFMTFTGLLLVESTLWLKDKAHFSSMAKTLLGTPGKVLSLIVYLFMNCTSLVAYTSGGAAMIDHWMRDGLGLSLGYELSCVLFTLLFGSVVYFGIGFTGRVNSWVTMVMGVIFCYLLVMGLSHLNPEYLVYRSAWLHGLSSVPLILAAFSYQMIVPSLCSYLNYEVGSLKKSILIGTSLPFAVYFLWLLVVHGIIPYQGAEGLHEAFVNGSMIVDPLKRHFSSLHFFFIVDVFAFLALATSYVGLSVALFDFVRDVFKGMSITLSQNQITFLSLAPTLVLAIYFPRALLDFLDLSGGFGDALLSGLIPVAMIWVGRYRMKLFGEYQTPGGKWALALAGSFSLFIFLFQWVKLFWPV